MASDIPDRIRWDGKVLTFEKLVGPESRVALYRYPAGTAEYFYVDHAQQLRWEPVWPDALRVPEGL